MKVTTMITEPNGEVLVKETQEINLEELNFDPSYEIDREVCKAFTKESDERIMRYINGENNSSDIPEEEESFKEMVVRILTSIRDWILKVFFEEVE